MVDELAAAPEHGAAVDLVLQLAREAAGRPIVQRVFSYDQVGQHRTHLDGRAVPLEPEIQTTFALAMSDFGAAGIVAQEMPLLAAAYRICGEEELLERLLEQLSEVASWSPIQRHGWTCYQKGNRLPEGGDGNWLATGAGIRAIGDTLEILPVDAVGEPLRRQLDDLLAGEIASIVDDWQVKRPWFVRGDNPVTNQWVLPTEGLVRACLIRGPDRHQQEYELGVANLLRALDAHGAAGEFEEGIGYATFTVGSLVAAARAMAAAGDRRAIDHPFLRHFPVWMTHHLQPGRGGVNCFDAGSTGHLGPDHAPFRQLLSLLLVCTDHATARWALSEQFDDPSDDLVGALARVAVESVPSEAPAAFALYERATRMNWRSSWSDDATGIWVRGGHRLDQHDHQDRGHVSFTRSGVPLLIEAGTPSYDQPEMSRLYKSGVGHNVLQVGTAMPPPPEPGAPPADPPTGWQQRHGGRPEAQSPVVAEALNPAGGRVHLEAGGCYVGVASWVRTVEWSAAGCRIRDRVELEEDTTDILLFRWHLATTEAAAIHGEDRSWRAEWGSGECNLESSAPMAFTQVTLPDRTLPRKQGEGCEHTCLVVQSRQPVRELEVETRFS